MHGSDVISYTVGFLDVVFFLILQERFHLRVGYATFVEALKSLGQPSMKFRI
jgi:hypothetical protein